MQKGLFITVEGIEGAGKSSALRYIADYFSRADRETVLSREPGGTDIAEVIRRILLGHGNEKIVPVTELLLMFAARSQHLHHVICPALTAGKVVICDRFVDSSYAYQCGGRGLDERVVTELKHLVQAETPVDLTLLLDAPPEVALRRALNENDPDRIECEQIDFFRRVRAAYLRRAHREPRRIRVIDAAGDDIEAVRQQVSRVLTACYPHDAGAEHVV